MPPTMPLRLAQDKAATMPLRLAQEQKQERGSQMLSRSSSCQSLGAVVDPDNDPYDPRSPEYITPASAEDVAAMNKLLVDEQIRHLEIALSLRSNEKQVQAEADDDQADILSHYQDLIAEMRCSSAEAAVANKGIGIKIWLEADTDSEASMSPQASPTMRTSTEGGCVRRHRLRHWTRGYRHALWKLAFGGAMKKVDKAGAASCTTKLLAGSTRAERSVCMRRRKRSPDRASRPLGRRQESCQMDSCRMTVTACRDMRRRLI